MYSSRPDEAISVSVYWLSIPLAGDTSTGRDLLGKLCGVASWRLGATCNDRIVIETSEVFEKYASLPSLPFPSHPQPRWRR